MAKNKTKPREVVTAGNRSPRRTAQRTTSKSLVAPTTCMSHAGAKTATTSRTGCRPSASWTARLVHA